jgi:rare lipoprotein A
MKNGSRTRQLLILLLIVLLAGCSTPGKRRGGGGYYSDDGPDAHPPSNLDSVPDAVPRIEPYASGANKPYVVFGKHYEPDLSGRPYRQTGIASWYGRKFHGHSTSTGEEYNMYSMTAAHTTLPIPSYARVTSSINGRSIIVRVNDRGPFKSDRIMDLSYVAAYKLGIIGPGSGEVTVQELTPSDIRVMLAKQGSEPQPSSATASRSLPAEGLKAPTMIAAQAPYATPARASMAAGSALSELPESDLDTNVAAGEPIAERPLPPIPVPLPPLSESPRTLSPQNASPRALPPRDEVAQIAAASGASSAQSAAGGVYLQFGAFGEPANAQSLVARLGRQLTGTGIPPARVDQAGRLFKVSVGPYADRQAAQQALETASSRTGLSASIVTR